MSPERAMLMEKQACCSAYSTRSQEMVLCSYCLLRAFIPPLLIAFSGGQERNVTCCMTDSL